MSDLPDPATLGALPREEILRMAADAMAVHSACLVALAHAPAKREDTLLTVADLAARLRLTMDWVYQHAAEMPFAMRIGTGPWRFSLIGFERWCQQQQGDHLGLRAAGPSPLTRRKSRPVPRAQGPTNGSGTNDGGS